MVHELKSERAAQAFRSPASNQRVNSEGGQMTNISFFRWLPSLFALTVLTSGCAPSGPADEAEAIYFGGPIVTMNDAQLNVEALAVKDGKILAVGSRAEVDKLYKGKATRVVDLAGKTLMPGFIDGHAHVGGFGSQAVGANLLAEPDGTANTIDNLVAKLQTFAKESRCGADRLDLRPGL